jgi:hypothetical protein
VYDEGTFVQRVEDLGDAEGLWSKREDDGLRSEYYLSGSKDIIYVDKKDESNELGEDVLMQNFSGIWLVYKRK